MPANSIAVYIYLLRHADRKTNRYNPSEATIAKRLHLSRNTVAKHIRPLEDRSLIVTENTEIITRRIKKNGNLLYTIISMCEVREQFHKRQLHELELATEHRQAQKKLSEQASA